MRRIFCDPDSVSLPDLVGLMRWRLILDAPCSGPENMARDESCLAGALEAGEPILRLYGWEGAVLSVGRNQKVERQIDLAAVVTGVAVLVAPLGVHRRADLPADDLELVDRRGALQVGGDEERPLRAIHQHLGQLAAGRRFSRPL